MQDQLTDRNRQLMARQSKLLAGHSPCFRIETLKMVLQANKFSFNSKYFKLHRFKVHIISASNKFDLLIRLPLLPTNSCIVIIISIIPNSQSSSKPNKILFSRKYSLSLIFLLLKQSELSLIYLKNKSLLHFLHLINPLFGSISTNDFIK